VEVPYPSMADIFYTLGYAPIIIALVLYFKTFSVALSKRRLAVAGAIIALATMLVVGFVLPIEFAGGNPLSTIITDLLYPILDLALLSLTILSLTMFIGGTIAKWWVVFGVGSIIYIIADELFLYQVTIGTYYNGGMDDLLFLLGYLTFGLAFYVHKMEF
jgi:hypothetical protein